MAVKGLEFDEISNQPKIKKAQIDVNEDNINSVFHKNCAKLY